MRIPRNLICRHFDLAGLHANPAQLDLPVGPSEAFQIAARQVAGQVARPIERARLVFVTEVGGERDKAFSREFGLVKVTGPQTRATDIKFAGNTRG